MPTAVQFYFDPVCPWTWITSRWVTEVAPSRDLDITWMPFSLRHLHRADWQRQSREQRERSDDLHRGLRVIMAARQRYGNQAVGDLYTTIGTLIHHDHDDHLQRLDAAIEAAFLDEDLIDAAEDASLDPAIEVSTDSAKELVGDQVGVPVIAIEGAASTFFGPVMSPAPTGEDALVLWDAYAALARTKGVFEIKRTRTTDPQLGPRPAVLEAAHR